LRSGAQGVGNQPNLVDCRQSDVQWNGITDHKRPSKPRLRSTLGLVRPCRQRWGFPPRIVDRPISQIVRLYPLKASQMGMWKRAQRSNNGIPSSRERVTGQYCECLLHYECAHDNIMITVLQVSCWKSRFGNKASLPTCVLVPRRLPGL